MAGRFVDVTLRLVDKMTAPLNSLGGRLAEHSRQWMSAGRSIQRSGRAIASVGSSLTKSVTAPIGAAGMACVKLAADFEGGMSKVKSISGATKDEVGLLGQKAKEMGAKTKFSATEATEAYQYMAMAGWKAGEMMDGIEGIMYLTGATGGDLAETSDIVTDALTAFGMTAADTEEFVDVLAKTASSANTDVSMMGESFKYVAPVAGSLGYNVQDVSTALGVMANSGIKASTAGTSLRSWMSRMAAPTDAVQGAMDRLGLSLTDSEGNMKDFMTMMKETRKGFAGLSEAEKAATASALAGKTGMSGLLAIVNATDSDFDSLAKSIYDSNGACKEMYEVANDNLQGQLTILKSTIESIAISFGERMTPYVKRLTGFLQGLADKFNSLSDSQKDTIIKIALVAASVGPALLAFGKLVTTVGKAVTTVGKIGRAFKNFGSIAGIIASPTGIVIGIIALIAAGAFLIIKNWDKIKPWLDGVKQWFTKTFGGAGGAFSKFGEAFGNVIDALAPLIQQAVEWLSGAIPKAGAVLSRAFHKIQPVLEKVFVKAVNIAADILLKLSAAFKKAVPAVISFAKGAIKKIAPVMKEIAAAVRKAAPVIKNVLVKSFEIIVPIARTVIQVLRSIITVVGRNLGKAVEAVKPVLSSLGELLRAVFDKMSERLRSFWEFIKPGVASAIALFLSIGEKLRPAFQVAIMVVGKIIKDFADTVGTVFSGIMGVVDGLITFITGVFTGNWRKAWEGVKGIFSSIFSTFGELAKKPLNAVIGIVNKAIEALNKVKVQIPAWAPVLGGKSFGINIPKIPTLAVGTDNWKGGLVQISERGGEIVDLPSGSRVYPHDESVSKAYHAGAASRAGSINVTIPKLADQIVVREEADVDRIVTRLADKLIKTSRNMGGGEVGYSY